MHSRFQVLLLASIIALSLFPLAHTDPTETRYFTSNAITYNGISIRTLETTPSLNPEARGILSGARFGIRAWKVDIEDSETEIQLDSQTGTPKATVIYVDDGWYNANVNSSETVLDPTDRILVRVYASKLTPVSWNMIQAFISEELGASSLDQATWTVYYWLEASGSTRNFWYGGAIAYNSRITGFAWTQAATKTWHSLAWNFNLSTRQWAGISWIANLSTMQWNSISWILNLTGQEWHSSAWALSLATMEWHSVYWVFALGEVSSIPVLFIGLAFFGSLVLIVFGWRLKKRRT